MKNKLLIIVVRQFLIILFFHLSCQIFAQPTNCDIKNKKADKLFQNAISQFRLRNTQQGIALLKQALEEEPDHVKSIYNLASAYYNEAEFVKAIFYYKKLVNICPGYRTDIYYKLGKSFYYIDNYTGCQEAIGKYLQQSRIRESQIRVADSLFTKCAFLEHSYANPVPYDPKPVEGICTEYGEYLPVLSPDNDLFFFIRSEPKKKKNAFSTQSIEEDFSVSIKDSGLFDRGEPLPPPFNMGSNEGGASITIDNLEMYLTICNRPDGAGSCDIYYTHEVNNYWTAPVNMNELTPGINTIYWESQVSISSDGNTLYFASSRPGGFGGQDIYKIVKDSLGQWSVPINLGPTINTRYNDKSPFIHVDNQTMYFSSKGHLGHGGFDIFYSRKDSNGQWTTPVNIGYPINSKADDLGFFVSTDGKTGYFASNKLKGVGGWDIYSFNLYKEARPKRVLFLKGEVKDEFDTPIPDAKIELKDLETHEITEVPVDTNTGKYVYTEVFESSKMLTVQKKDYIYQSEIIDTNDTAYSMPKTIDINLEPILKGAAFTIDDSDYNMENLLFDTDSYELKKHALIELENLVQFMNMNPTVRIAIHGHTDNVGDAAKNQILSENRAYSVYQFLIEHKILKNRLSYKGLGEMQPISSNNTDKGRRLNRRTEIIILKK